VAALAALVADGRLRPNIGLVLPWERTAAAFAALTSRSFRGKAVLTCASQACRPVGRHCQAILAPNTTVERTPSGKMLCGSVLAGV